MRSREIRARAFFAKLNAARASHPSRIGLWMSRSPFHCRKAVTCAFRNHTHEGMLVSPHTMRIEDHGLSPQAPPAKTAQADGSVLPQGGPSKEAATPTSPKHAMKAHALNTLWETLRQFTLENRRKRQLDRNPTALSRHLTFQWGYFAPARKRSQP